MSTFRRYGGLNHSANNNIIRSYISNSEQMNINNSSGQPNSKEVFLSHIDMNGNSILHVGTIYFQNGTSISSYSGTTGAGPQGATGQGVTGPQGATGQGITGPQGATGQGITGPQGATGQGVTGPQGATGPPGSSDSSYWSAGVTGIYYNGFVGLGNTAPSCMLDVTGNINSTGTISTGSDYRIKDSIRPLDLEEYSIDKLNPVYFKFKDTGKENIGLIAHELQDYYPFLVEGEKDAINIQKVNYNGLIGVLIKEIQELKKRVSKLEKIE